MPSADRKTSHASRDSRDSSAGRRVRGAMSSILCLGASAMVAVGATGCAKSLFPSDLPRNQFETHDRMRQAYVPLEEPDVFGTPQPALRARLTQQEQ